ncbi:MAG: hypothetical protein ACYCVN_08160 [Acidimicrobiales bacterium]
MAVVAMAGMVVQAVRSDRVVGSLMTKGAVRSDQVDNAYYRCLDVQTRSLVSPGQPVAFAGSNPYDVIILLQAVGSWITVAPAPVPTTLRLSLRSDPGRGCLGTVVVSRTVDGTGRSVVRIGTGAHVPGAGPVPATPL